MMAGGREEERADKKKRGEIGSKRGEEGQTSIRSKERGQRMKNDSGLTRLDDALVIATDLVAVRAASLVIHQRVSRGAVLLADARITAALVAPSGRPRRQPAAWLAAYRPLLAPQEPQ